LLSAPLADHKQCAKHWSESSLPLPAGQACTASGVMTCITTIHALLRQWPCALGSFSAIVSGGSGVLHSSCLQGLEVLTCSQSEVAGHISSCLLLGCWLMLHASCFTRYVSRWPLRPGGTGRLCHRQRQVSGLQHVHRGWLGQVHASLVLLLAKSHSGLAHCTPRFTTPHISGLHWGNPRGKSIATSLHHRPSACSRPAAPATQQAHPHSHLTQSAPSTHTRIITYHGMLLLAVPVWAHHII
jgi:hypothetical protein